MDLEPMIAKVAVLRSQARAADKAAYAATKASEEARSKYHEANRELDEEIVNRVNNLDPDAG